MKHKDILELKKRLKKDQCTISQMSGCYVNSEKEIVSSYRDTFLNLEESDFFKYLELARKTLSGAMGNNLLELDFKAGETEAGGSQELLLQLKSSRLKDDELLQNFYRRIIDHFHYTGNYLILLFADAYDVIRRTSDNLKLDESEETYEYILCAICPVTLSDPGLHYKEDERKMRAHHRDWMVAPPVHGFLYPAFTDHSGDVSHVLYYTKNAREPQGEIMEEVLGCQPMKTTAIHRDAIQVLLQEATGYDEATAEKLHIELHENLQRMMEDQEFSEAADEEPMVLTSVQLQDLIADRASEEILEKIEKVYGEYFDGEMPQADRILDNRVLKAAQLKKKEFDLEKQVENLKAKLEEVHPAEAENEATEGIAEALDAEEPVAIRLLVKPDKVPQVRLETIQGQKCLVVPLAEDEKASINGERNLFEVVTPETAEA